jgi:hypothetical protein
MWKSLRVRPGRKTDHPENTDQRYCVWDEPHGDYLYTQAWVEKVIRTRKAQLINLDGSVNPWSVPLGVIPNPMTVWRMAPTPNVLYVGAGAGPNFSAPTH